MGRTLVLGVGNPLIADEGLGVEAVNLLREKYRFKENIEIVDGGTKGLELLRFFENVENLIIVDAVYVKGKRAGDIVRIEKEKIKYYLKNKMSVHDIGIDDLISVLEFTGRMPKRVVLIGMVPEKIEFFYGLSKTVETKLEALVKEVVKQLEKWNIKVLTDVDECSSYTK